MSFNMIAIAVAAGLIVLGLIIWLVAASNKKKAPKGPPKSELDKLMAAKRAKGYHP